MSLGVHGNAYVGAPGSPDFSNMFLPLWRSLASHRPPGCPSAALRAFAGRGL